jgi:hypothetical protein
MSQACRECIAAAVRPWHGFASDCKGCAARAIARGPNYRQAQAGGRQDWKYRAELEALGVTHEQVKAAAAADALAKEAAA